MAAANEIYGWYKDFFDRNELNYDEDAESNNIKIVMPLDGKLQKTNMMVRCLDSFVSVKAYAPLNADEGVRHNVAEYLARANYGMAFGNFELDVRDGEVSFKLTLDCEDRSSLSDDLIGKTFVLPQNMLEKYGDGLLAVMFGMKSPEEAIDEAEDESCGCGGHDHDDD
ncbi:MAG: YbjN domain-containing protein [Oscillospiraceae bacterium]|nr:YbjN domain-containing protein [Oscillospiraceae bacterium]